MIINLKTPFTDHFSHVICNYGHFITVLADFRVGKSETFSSFYCPWTPGPVEPPLQQRWKSATNSSIFFYLYRYHYTDQHLNIPLLKIMQIRHSSGLCRRYRGDKCYNYKVVMHDYIRYIIVISVIIISSLYYPSEAVHTPWYYSYIR